MQGESWEKSGRRLRPGLSLVFPIDSDFQEVIDLVLGLRLGVFLP